MRKLLVTAIALAVLGSLSGPALAGKGGSGGNGGNGGNSGGTAQPAAASIDLCQVDGVAVNGCAGPSATTASSGAPHLGSAVAFATVGGDLAGWEYPMVDLYCKQDGALVFMQLDQPDAIFLLGGGSSDWLTNSGSASCQADLDAYGHKGGAWSVRVLASVTFEVEG